MSRSQRAVSTLMEVDPDFQAMAKILYGPSVDAEGIWQDVFTKRAPEIAPAHERVQKFMSEETQRKIALATNAGGVVAAPGALYMARRAWKNNEGGIPRAAARAATKNKPNSKVGRLVATADAGKKAGRKGAILATAAGVTGMGLQAANSTGDAIAARMMAKKPKDVAKRYYVEVEKNVPIGQQAGGIYNSMLRMLKPTGKHVAPPQPKALKPSAGTSARPAQAGGFAANLRDKPVQTLTGTPAGAGLLGGTATYAATRPGNKRARNQGFQEGYYAKADTIDKPMPDLELAGTFSKFDDEKRQAFGYASVVKKNGLPVIDRQGDYIDADEMEKAAYHYVQKSRVGGDMHRRKRDEYGIDKAHHVSDLIESMVFTEEKCKAMGLPDEVAKALDGHWWVGYQIHDEDTWDEVRKKGRTGFSIHGRGKRVDTSIDELV